MSFSETCNRFLIKFFSDVLPALPVTAIILAEVSFLLYLASRFKKTCVFFTFIIFLFFLIAVEEETTQPAPFFKALFINVFPSFFFPFIAKNRLSFCIVLVSIESPLKFNQFFFSKI